MLGEQLRDEGIARVSIGKEQWMANIRKLAGLICQSNGSVSINDLKKSALPEGAHHNLWGSVFKHQRFVPVGYTKATHPKAHARVIRVYKLRGQEDA